MIPAEDAFAQIGMRLAAGTPADSKKIVLDTLEKVGEELDVQFTEGYPPVNIDCDVPGMYQIAIYFLV